MPFTGKQFDGLAVAIVVLALGASVALAFGQHLDDDEIRILHDARDEALGLPLFDEMIPFPYFTLPAMGSWVFRATDNEEAAIVALRLFALVFHAAVMLMVGVIGRRLFQLGSIWPICAVWAIQTPVFLKSFEFRTVHWAMFFALAAVELWLRDAAAAKSDPRRTVTVGAAWALAVLFQVDLGAATAAFMGVVLVFALARGPSRFRWSGVAGPAVGAAAVFALYLAAFCTLTNIKLYVLVQYVMVVVSNAVTEVEWNRVHYLDPRWVIPLVLWGVIGARVVLADGWGAVRGAVLGLAALFGIFAVYAATRPVFYHQNMYPFVLPCVVLAGAGLDRLAGRPRGAALAALWLVGIVALGVWPVARFLHDDLVHRGEFRERFLSAFTDGEDGAEGATVIDANRLESGLAQLRGFSTHVNFQPAQQRALDSRVRATLSAGERIFDPMGSIIPSRNTRYGEWLPMNFHRERKFQTLYRYLRDGDDPFVRTYRRRVPPPFRSMRDEDVLDALRTELTTRPPAAIVLDGHLEPLIAREDFRGFLDARYRIEVWPDALTVVALRKDRPAGSSKSP